MSCCSSHLIQLVVRDGFKIDGDGVYVVSKNSCVKCEKDDEISYNREDSEYWSFKNGLLHSCTGPAFIGTGGHKEWWSNGSKVPKEDWIRGLSETDLKIALLNPDNF